MHGVTATQLATSLVTTLPPPRQMYVFDSASMASCLFAFGEGRMPTWLIWTRAGKGRCARRNDERNALKETF